MWDASGGSEWRTVSLFEQLAEQTEVTIWTEYAPDPALVGKYPVREMLKTRTFPTSGTFVFLGAYWEIGAWMKLAKPSRVILVYNVVDPYNLEKRIAQLRSYGVDEIELVFSSELIAAHANGRQGTVELSPIDFNRFVPAERKSGGPVVLGRHSRDQIFKHHPGDSALYRIFAGEGGKVRILGGTCLQGLSDISGIELLPANSIPAEQFLQSLDIFFYRTSPQWTESYGRIVAEAMGCGLPCVVERGAGYETLIQNGKNGFLFTEESEAWSLISALSLDAKLRAKIGDTARSSIVQRYEAERKRMLAYYLEGV